MHPVQLENHREKVGGITLQSRQKENDEREYSSFLIISNLNRLTILLCLLPQELSQ